MSKLSNIEVVLLSIVNEKPSYAYEIDKIIEKRDMRKWVKIGVASIYQVLERLERKGLLFSRREKEGRMPVRKRYYITEAGKAVMKEASLKLLSEMEWYYLDLNVGLESSDLLTPEEIADCFRKRLGKVNANIRKLCKFYRGEKLFKGRVIIKNLIYFREAEKKFLEDMLRELEQEVLERGAEEESMDGTRLSR